MGICWCIGGSEIRKISLLGEIQKDGMVLRDERCWDRSWGGECG